MTDTKKPTHQPKLADVTHPGHSAPSPNSRSVIVSHRPIMRDPMMSANLPGLSKSEEEIDTTTLPTATASVSRVSGGVVQPLSNNATDSSPIAPEINQDDAKPKASEPSSTTAKKDDEQPQSTSSSEANLGTKDAQTEAELAAAEDAETERQAKLQSMIESKQFFLPINTVEKQRTKQFVAAGSLLSVLLIVVWADIALDAGLIKLGNLHALTHFFK